MVDEGLADREEAIKVRILLGEPHQPARAEPRRRLTEDADLAGAHADQIADRVDQGGLAGSVGTEQREELARRDLEVQVAQGDRPVVVTLVEARDTKRGLGCLAHPWSMPAWASVLAKAPHEDR